MVNADNYPINTFKINTPFTMSFNKHWYGLPLDSVRGGKINFHYRFAESTRQILCTIYLGMGSIAEVTLEDI